VSNIFFRNTSRQQLKEALKIHWKNSFGYVVLATILLFASVSQYTQYVMVIEPMKAVNISVGISAIVFFLINWYAILSYIPDEEKEKN
jgi:hypothetical protein